MPALLHFEDNGSSMLKKKKNIKQSSCVTALLPWSTLFKMPMFNNGAQAICCP